MRQHKISQPLKYANERGAIGNAHLVAPHLHYTSAHPDVVE